MPYKVGSEMDWAGSPSQLAMFYIPHERSDLAHGELSDLGHPCTDASKVFERVEDERTRAGCQTHGVRSQAQKDSAEEEEINAIALELCIPIDLHSN